MNSSSSAGEATGKRQWLAISPILRIQGLLASDGTLTCGCYSFPVPIRTRSVFKLTLATIRSSVKYGFSFRKQSKLPG